MASGAGPKPTSKSVAAKLVSRMFEFVRNSLVFNTVTITKMFKRIVPGHEMAPTMNAR